MPSRQQKSAKKDSERYLMFGTNHFLVTLRWDEGRFPGHRNVCRQIINGSVKTKKSCASRNVFEIGFKFSKLVKGIMFRCLRATKTVGSSKYSIRFT